MYKLSKVEIVRESVKQIVPMLAAKKIPVHQVGTEAAVRYDGRGEPNTVFLPHLPDTASDDLITAVQGFLDHEVAHLLFSDFKVLARASKSPVGMLHNSLEDIMIERKMKKAYKGSAHNLTTVWKFMLDKRIDPTFQKLKDSGNVGQILGALGTTAFRAWAGCPVSNEYMQDKWHYFEPMRKAIGDDSIEELKSMSNSEETLRTAMKIFNRMQEYKAREEQEQREKEEKEKREKEEQERRASDSETNAHPDEEMEESKSESKDGEQQENDAEPGEGTGDDTDEDDAGDEPSDDEGQGEGDDDESEEGDDAEGEDESDAEDESQDDDTDEDESEDDDEGDDAESDEQDEEPADEDEGEEESDDHDEGESEEEEESDDTDEEESEEEESMGEDEDESEESDEDDGNAGLGDDTDEESDEDDASQSGADDADGEEGEGDDAEQGAEGEANGAGSKEMMEALEQMKDTAKDMAEAIAEMARSSATSGDYYPVTRDHDVIERLATKELGNNDQLVDHLQQQVGAMTATLQKRLERFIAARSHARMVPGFRSGKIHTSSLYRLTTGDERVFRRKQETRTKDVAVQLVVDMSGSMEGRKVELALQSAYAMSSTLDRMNIKNEVIGFTTCHMWDPDPTRKRRNHEAHEAGHVMASKTGRHPSRVDPIYMPIIKPFDERLSNDRRLAFAQAHETVFLAENVDGESIEYAFRRLAGRNETRKIMIVLSDGMPSCTGNHHQLAAHLRNTVKKIMASGVDVFGIGIMDDSVRQFYPMCEVIHRVDQLPTKVMQTMGEMLFR